jgi:hypothetical protein
MKRGIILGTTTALILSSFGTATLAQSTSTDVDAGVTTGVDATVDQTGTDMAANTNANANAGGELNFGQIISGLRTGEIANTDFSTLGEDVTIETVLLSEIAGDKDPQALENALEAEADAMRNFHDQIAENAKLSAELAEENFSPDDVIAVRMQGNNKVTLVIDDRS